MDQHIINPKDGSELILIPEGEFIMGSDLFDESPQHSHYLPAYYLSLYPVTNQQYEQFVKETGNHESDLWREYYTEGKESHPVVKVSWYDARAYCRWAGLRLPTEPEWEKGSRGVDGREYPWGNDWDAGRCRNMVETEEDVGTCEVTSYSQYRSPYGLYQMSGNIWEWCENRYAEDLYAGFARGDFQMPDSGDKGVLRGGGWQDVDEFFFRCSTRLSNDRNLRHHLGGFRPAR